MSQTYSQLSPELQQSVFGLTYGVTGGDSNKTTMVERALLDFMPTR
jgi:hypothetical protein